MLVSPVTPVEAELMCLDLTSFFAVFTRDKEITDEICFFNS